MLNFALRFEYPAAELHLRAFDGTGLPGEFVTGLGTVGAIVGGRKVRFANPVVAAIANDNKNYVLFLRLVLGARAVAHPAVDIGGSPQAAAMAAGIIGPGGTFDPYADDLSFPSPAAVMPRNPNGPAFSPTPRQVLNVACGAPGTGSSFPPASTRAPGIRPEPILACVMRSRSGCATPARRARKRRVPRPEVQSRSPR